MTSCAVLAIGNYLQNLWFGSASRLAEIGLRDGGVLEQFFARAGLGDAALLENIGVVRDGERLERILLHEQNGLAHGLDLADGIENGVDQQRREAEGRLVEHDEVGRGHDAAAHRQHLLLAAGERAGDLIFALLLAWALFTVSVVVCAFECGIEYSTGRGNLQQTALNIIKGFLAVSLFTVVPVRLYALSVSLQGTFSAGLTGYGRSIGEVGQDIITELSEIQTLADVVNSSHFGLGIITSPIMLLFCVILMGYAVLKVFFANLKRGGILLIQIAVGSLYMFSVPRGYLDGFMGWMRQVIGLCLTAFLQSTILVAGLMVFKDHALMGVGLMLSAGEVPRIAGSFGLDTTTKANITSAVYTAQSAVNVTRTFAAAIK